MNTKSRIVIVLTLALLGAAVLVAVTWAAPRSMPLAGGGAPAVVAYQGEVQVSDIPYSGNGYFKFAVVNPAGDTAYWSNDGTSTEGGEPTAAVQLTVSEGLFSVLLGDTASSGMTQALRADVFSQPDRYLRVWFSTSAGGPFSQLTPDTRIAAVPYALQAQQAVGAETLDGYEGAALEESSEIDADIAAHAAVADAHHARYTDAEAWAAVLANDGSGTSLDADTLDGLHASQLGVDYQNVVVVAKSGGDFTSVQAAINSISDAAADKPYLVWVAPGVYVEQVTMKPYVHLQGAGQGTTLISSSVSSSAWPPTQATLALASDTSLRDLTVVNNGAGNRNVALMATAGVTRTLAADMTARALGGSVNNFAIVLTGSGTGVTVQQVTALAENGSSKNYGLYNEAGAEAVLIGGTFTGRGGTDAYGIYNEDNGTTLETKSVTALGEDGSTHNFGLINYSYAEAMLRGGSFTGRGGADAVGIYNESATLEAESVSALSEDGSTNKGLLNYQFFSPNAAVTLRGGTFTGSGGTVAYGIQNDTNVGSLKAERISALSVSGGNNYGLHISAGTANVTQSVLEGASQSVWQSGGSITVSNSRLVGGGKLGTVTCVLVTRGTTVSTDGSTCP